jgi:hypothetical protein
MRTHTASELQFNAQVLDKDATTVVIASIRCSVSDLTGSRLEKQPGISSETTHVIVVRYPDGSAITGNMYFLIEGILYVIDNRPLDAYPDRAQRPKQWLEINAHVERSGQ